MGGALNRELGWERDPGREATPGQLSRSRGGSLCRYVYLCVSLSQSAFYSHTLVFLNTPASGVCLHPFNGLQVYTLFCLFPNSFFYVPVFHAEIFQNITRNQVNKHFCFVHFVGAKFPLQQRDPPKPPPPPLGWRGQIFPLIWPTSRSWPDRLSVPKFDSFASLIHTNLTLKNSRSNFNLNLNLIFYKFYFHLFYLKIYILFDFV